MNRIGSLTLSLGLAPLVVASLACSVGEKQDPAKTVPVSDAPQAQSQAGQSAPPGANTSPPIPHGDPRVNLTYEGAVYYSKVLGDDGAANLN